MAYTPSASSALASSPPVFTAGETASLSSDSPTPAPPLSKGADIASSIAQESPGGDSVHMRRTRARSNLTQRKTIPPKQLNPADILQEETKTVVSNKENLKSPPKPRVPRLKLLLKRPDDLKEAESTISAPRPHDTSSPLPINQRPSFELELQGTRNIKKRSALGYLSPSPRVTKRKRALPEIASDTEDDTDSEIELFPKKKRRVKATPKTIQLRVPSPAPAKPETVQTNAKVLKQTVAAEAKDEDSDEDSTAQQLSLFTPLMKRTKRILDASNPAHAALIASATKIGNEYYDSDADELPGDVKDTSKPHLFRNVKWGTYAEDYSNDGDFVSEPEFTQFVPGRFELQPDGTVSDQKAKLIIKLVDKSGRKRIFANPPPRDWNNQEAITALNKRTVQQIRRNTNVRFREVVRAYVAEERKWILANLTHGKPTMGWKVFVEQFNKRFEGKVLPGAKGERPHRSHSSLTKEVERFGPEFYMRGRVPVASSKRVKKE